MAKDDDVEDEMIDEEDEFVEDVDEKPGTKEKKAQEMEEGELEEDVYSEEGREKELEDDEIEPWEEGFMKGAEKGGQGAKCRYCGKVLVEKEDVVEREINGESYLFCSEDHLNKYLKEKLGKK